MGLALFFLILCLILEIGSSLQVQSKDSLARQEILENGSSQSGDESQEAEKVHSFLHLSAEFGMWPFHVENKPLISPEKPMFCEMQVNILFIAFCLGLQILQCAINGKWSCFETHKWRSLFSPTGRRTIRTPI